MNEAISACRFLKVQGSYMRELAVIRSNCVGSIIMNEAVSACRLLKVEGSYMLISTV